MDDKTKHLTPVWIIYIDGKRLDVEQESALSRIFIHDVLNGISTFSLVFDATGIPDMNKKIVSLESEISIHLGYKDDIDEVFSGDVLGFKILFPEYGAGELEISGCNILHKLTHGFHNRGFEEQSHSSVIKGLIDSYSLKAEVEDFGTVQNFMAYEDQADYDFIMKMADMYGKDVFAAGKTIYVGNQISVRTDEIIVEWGKSLITFEAEKNINGQISGFDFIGWDELKDEGFVGYAELSDIPFKVGGSEDWTAMSKGGSGKFYGARINFAQKDADDAKQLAIGQLQKNSFLFCQAKGTAEGNYKLRPGMRVMVKGVGETFEGEYIADTVIHRFDRRSGYVTEFTLKRNMFS